MVQMWGSRPEEQNAESGNTRPRIQTPECPAGTKPVQWSKKIVFSTNGTRTAGYQYAKKKKKKNLDPYLTLYSKLNRKPKNIKLLENMR